MDRRMELEEHLKQKMQQHKLLNSAGPPEDIDERNDDLLKREAKLFGENDRLWKLDGNFLAFHDRHVRVLTERKKGNRFHTQLVARIMQFSPSGRQMTDVDIQLNLEALSPLRAINGGEVYKCIALPSENLLGFLYFEGGDWDKLRSLVVKTERMDILLGRDAILAHKQATTLSSSTPQPPQRSSAMKRRM